MGRNPIADINCIIAVILGAPNTYRGRVDVNNDGEVNSADVNAVIDMILNAYYPTSISQESYTFISLVPR